MNKKIVLLGLALLLLAVNIQAASIQYLSDENVYLLSNAFKDYWVADNGLGKTNDYLFFWTEEEICVKFAGVEKCASQFDFVWTVSHYGDGSAMLLGETSFSQGAYSVEFDLNYYINDVDDFLAVTPVFKNTGTGISDLNVLLRTKNIQIARDWQNDRITLFDENTAFGFDANREGYIAFTDNDLNKRHYILSDWLRGGKIDFWWSEYAYRNGTYYFDYPFLLELYSTPDYNNGIVDLSYNIPVFNNGDVVATQFRWVDASTGYVDPDGDVTTGWQFVYPAGGTHESKIDEINGNQGNLDAGDYIYGESGDTGDDYCPTYVTDEFNMETLTVDSVSVIKVWAHGDEDSGEGCTLRANIKKDAVWQTAQDMSVPATQAWMSVTWSGLTWTQTNLTNLQVRLEMCCEEAEGDGTVRINAMYGEITYTYTPPVSLPKSPDVNYGTPYAPAYWECATSIDLNVRIGDKDSNTLLVDINYRNVSTDTNHVYLDDVNTVDYCDTNNFYAGQDCNFPIVTPVIDGNVQWIVHVIDDDGNFDIAYSPSFGGTCSPSIDWISPYAPNWYAGGGAIAIDLNFTDQDDNTMRFDLNYFLAGVPYAVLTDQNTVDYCDSNNFYSAQTCSITGVTTPVIDGNIQYYAVLTDDLGNSDTNQCDFNFGIDSTEPTVYCDANQSWQNFDANVTTTCTDAGADMNSIAINFNNIGFQFYTNTDRNWFIQSADGNNPITFFCIDNVGNKTDQNTVYISVDKTVPIISPISPDTNGLPFPLPVWTYTWNVSDATSGIASCDANLFDDGALVVEKHSCPYDSNTNRCSCVIPYLPANGSKMDSNVFVKDVTGNEIWGNANYWVYQPAFPPSGNGGRPPTIPVCVDFNVSPQHIELYYSGESFFLPKITIEVGDAPVNLNALLSCIEGTNCLIDYCLVPSNIFLAANESRQIQIECNLPEGEDRTLVGRLLFVSINNDSCFTFTDIYLTKASPSFLGGIGFGVWAAAFWGLLVLLAILLVAALAARKLVFVIAFVVVLAVFLFLFYGQILFFLSTVSLL